MTEADLQAQVIGYCRFRGYLVHACGNALTCDGKGFPDLIISSPRGVIFAELKAHSMSKMSPEQSVWASMLRASGQIYRVWMVKDWESRQIQRDLERLGGIARVEHPDHDRLPGHDPNDAANCAECKAIAEIGE